MKYRYALLIAGALLGCRKSSEPLFTALTPSESGVRFENTIVENDTFNLVDYYYVYNGGGVAVGDLNNDNLPDLFFTGNQVGDRLFVNRTKPGSGNPQFEDVTAGMNLVKGGWSTGATMADVNADGLLDIYVCKSGNYPGDRRKNQLYINKGNFRFEERAGQYGVADTSYTNQAAFFDYDKDGDLDLYLLTSTNLIRNPNQVTPVIADGSGLANDKLFRNDSQPNAPHFTEVTREAGILHDGFGLGLTIADFNQDGWEDIYVANDFLANDFLYLNRHDGTFTETGKAYFKHHSQFSMGCDAADVNNDGLTDLVVADMLPPDNEQRKKMAGPANNQHFERLVREGYHPQFMRNMLQINGGTAADGRVVFSEIGQFSGVSATDWSWSPLLADLDNDGWRDMFITNGYLRDVTDLDFVSFNNSFAKANPTTEEVNAYLRKGAVRMPTLRRKNHFFRNNHDLTFEDVTGRWIGEETSLSNGATYADLDGDGDLDLVVNNINQNAFILRNNSSGTRYIRFKLKGPAANPFGSGADVTVFTKGLRQVYHQAVTRGFQSSTDYTIHFGLGKATMVDSVRIAWPDGQVQVQKDLGTNQLITLDHRHSRAAPAGQKREVALLFSDITASSGVDYMHQDEYYIDYNQETLLPHKLSQQGPKLAVGDVNGDGLDDFFAGGSFRHYGKLFIQTKAGKFVEKKYTDDALPKDEEDVGVLLFDADRDGDNDLYIVSGSNEYLDGSPYYQDRLYLNDGKGKFTAAPDRLPEIRHSGSCIIVVDVDQDGDLDLFRGGRLTALQYPLAGKSYLLINENGRFRDATDKMAPQLRSAGMVTDAVWADVDQDSWPDLLVVGEMMPITLFKNNQGKLSPHSANGLKDTDGFWNCIKAADFDEDGDMDFVVGNLGLNTRYRVSAREPMRIYAGDYDGNGRLDAIPFYYLQGIEYPVPSREELGRQIPMFKKVFPSYAAYAKATVSEIMTPERLAASALVKASEQRSMLLENVQGNFRLRPLPAAAQWAPIQSMWVKDVDHDGHADVLAVGNDYGIESVTGQYDAMTGLFLKGDGKGGFKSMHFSETGFLADGDSRSVVGLNSPIHQLIAVSSNRGLLRIFKQNTVTK